MHLFVSSFLHSAFSYVRSTQRRAVSLQQQPSLLLGEVLFQSVGRSAAALVVSTCARQVPPPRPMTAGPRGQ